MAMHNPPHPGEFISSVYLEPNDISGRELAASLGVATSTLSRVLKGSSAVSPEMALRLSKALGRTPESWLAMQYQYDLWRAKQHVDLARVGKVRLTADWFLAYSCTSNPPGVITPKLALTTTYFGLT
jgi:addiction module HigA family antidote